jgi:16S rRNA (uracil1498-N3)-methyltransferase
MPLVALTAGRVELPKDEAHHAARVLRLGPGDDVRVFDGRGHEWAGRIVASANRRDVTVEIDSEVTPVAEPFVHVTLAIGLLKGDQMDTVVRDATALGVAAIVPMVTAHVTVPERAHRAGAAVERWERVAVASAKQCRRAVVPAIEPVSPLTAVLERPADTTLMCTEPDISGQTPAVVPPRGPSALVLIGPEGGWSGSEVDETRARGAVFVSLGSRTLRAELAPTVLLAFLWSHWGWE